MSYGLPPAPVSALERHRLLAPNASVMVSPLCLGAMSFGHAYKDQLGDCSKETAFEILDYFKSKGGNFVDTANLYQNGESEQWLGEWMEQRGNRDEMVIATKYTGGFRATDGFEKVIQSNFAGSGTKSMVLSLNNSLKLLKTDYIDLLYVHFWDMRTSIPELMQSLNHLVASGKVLYLGISDAPAWVVVKANAYARQHGLRQFSVYQGRWSAAMRDLERDVVPMCRDEGMSIMPWGALGGGFFKPQDQLNRAGAGRNTPGMMTGNEGAVYEALKRVADRHGGVPVTSVALRYVMYKEPYVFPLCGTRKVEHIKGNIEALSLKLTAEDMADIEKGYDFDPGFPHSMLAGPGNKHVLQGPRDVFLTNLNGTFDYVENHKSIETQNGNPWALGFHG